MSKLQPLRTTPPYDEPWKVATLINRIMGGRLNSVGAVTLTQNGTSTLVSDNNYRIGSYVFLQALSADAATVTGIYVVPGSTTGQFTVRHSAVNQSDLNFSYVIIG